MICTKPKVWQARYLLSTKAPLYLHVSNLGRYSSSKIVIVILSHLTHTRGSWRKGISQTLFRACKKVFLVCMWLEIIWSIDWLDWWLKTNTRQHDDEIEPWSRGRRKVVVGSHGGYRECFSLKELSSFSS